MTTRRPVRLSVRRFVPAVLAFAGFAAFPSAAFPQASSPGAPPAPTSDAAPYTAAQAEAGKDVYEASCANCHVSDLSGKDDAPALRGAYFASSWGGHTIAELIDYVRSDMPDDEPGTLSEDAYLRAVAYILSRNGVPAGQTPLARGVEGNIPGGKD